MKALLTANATLLLLICASNVMAEETVVRKIWLPGASLEQEVTFYPTESEYLTARDQILKRLREGDPTAMVNPSDGPWMRAETTAQIGLEVKGVGAAEGRKNYRQVSAAEDALYTFENE